MSLDDDIRVLSKAQLFDALQPEQLRLLAFGAERLRFNQGRTLYREGERADCGFVVASGEIQLTREMGSEESTVRVAKPGSILGEIAMITETTRLTSAVAQTDCEVVRINRTLFGRMLSEYPQTAADIHADLSERLQVFLKEIGRLEGRFSKPLDL